MAPDRPDLVERRRCGGPDIPRGADLNERASKPADSVGPIRDVQRLCFAYANATGIFVALRRGKAAQAAICTRLRPPRLAA